MKKLFKLATLFIFVLVLSGCSADYDLVIDENNVVTEKLKVTIPNKIILQGNDDIDVFLENRIKSYKSIRSYKNYVYDSGVGKNNSFIEMTMKYKNLKDYSNSPILNGIFENLNVVENNKFTTFKTVGEYYYNDIYGAEPTDDGNGDGLQSGSPTQSAMGDVNITIKLHNKLIESNADIEDEKNNVYTWKLTPDSKQEYIYIKYSNDKRYDIIIKDFIGNYMTVIILTGVIVGVILGIFILIWGKHLISNKI
ncbi:MAG: hypothetical protein ACM3O4_01785 [Ignavibacteriales bacterium]